MIFCVLTFRAFGGILKRLKGEIIPKNTPLVNEALETHLAKTKGFVFHACHPLLATHKSINSVIDLGSQYIFNLIESCIL
ncbi:hypothetical protein FIM79_05825 [Helicobacter pylori]|nr:hypothetical protein FIM79_05825 [Helicobacter pylori]